MKLTPASRVRIKYFPLTGTKNESIFYTNLYIGLFFIDIYFTYALQVFFHWQAQM